MLRVGGGLLLIGLAATNVIDLRGYIGVVRMTAKVFGAALGIADPWSVASVDFDVAAKVLTVLIDFKSGSSYAVSGHQGEHPVHDTVTKTYRHMNFFQRECLFQVRTLRVKLLTGPVRLELICHHRARKPSSRGAPTRPPSTQRPQTASAAPA